MKEILNNTFPTSEAYIYGSDDYPDINGIIRFYKSRKGTLTAVQIRGLPHDKGACKRRVFGFHIHEGALCSGTWADPFADAGGHFNPNGCLHPKHAGDMPPIFGDSQGYAMMIFYTDRFRPDEIVGRTVIIHDMPDDFHTQPSGNAGTKIACGEIFAKHKE